MSKLVRDFIRDTLFKVRDDISFSYARESDFNAIKGKTFPAVLLLPLRFDSERVGTTTNRKYNVTMLFYALDSLQGAEEETEAILDQTDELLTKFQALLNVSLTDDDPDEVVTTEKIVISNESIKERIKFTSDCVTGWEYTFDMEVPDQSTYCDFYD